MSLHGLPDFADSPVPGVFGPFEGSGPYRAVPERLVVANRSDGSPDFILQVYRPEDPGSPPAPYGLLELGLRPSVPIDAALAELRALRPRAELAPLQLGGGFARLHPAHEIDGGTPDLVEPRPLSWNGLETAHWSLRLSLADATLMKDELMAGLVALVGSADLEIEGVAPRVDATVRLDPGRFFPLLAALGDERARTTRAQLVAFFATGGPGDPNASPSPIGLEVLGTAGEPRQFAEVMADWTRARHATALPGHGDEPGGSLHLALADVPGTGVMEWDLRSPIATFRPLTLSFSPLDAAFAAIAAGRSDEIIPPPVVVPRLALGAVEIAVRANLPRSRPAVLDIGVTVTAPPRPPIRPQAVVAAWSASDGSDHGVIRLKLAPSEPLRYRYQTFVVLDDTAEPLAGISTESDRPRIDLGPDDFAVRFVTIGAEAALLELAALRARVRWTEDALERERTVVLDAAHPEVAVALPAAAGDPRVEIDAEPTPPGRALHLGPLPLARLQVGLHSFADYGPQALEIEGLFPDDPAAGPVLVLDLAAEQAADEAATTVALTRTSPRRTWTYLATSPFRSGYRFRRRIGGEPTSWSAPRLPREPLVVDTRGPDAPGGTIALASAERPT